MSHKQPTFEELHTKTTFDPNKMSNLLLSNMLKKLEARERELRTLTDNISDFLVRYDREGRFVFMNKSLQSLLGVNFTTIKGKKPTDILGLPDAELFEQTVLRIVETGVQESFVHTLTIDGNTLMGLVNATPEIDDEGNVQYVQFLTRDVTEQKQMEKTLRETNERFTQIYDNSIDVIYLIEVTPEGRFIYRDVNAAYEVITEISREAVIGVDVEAIEDETFREILLDKFNFCLKRGEKCDYINDYPFPSGTRTFHSALTPMFDEEGRIYQIVGVARDITEQKEGEKRLQLALEFNEEVMRTIPDLMFELDAQGVYKNIWAQDEKLLAAQKKHLLGKNIRDILSHDAVEVSLHMMGEVDATGQSLGNTMHVDLPEERKYFELSASLKKSSGTYIVLSRDITERKRSEEALAIREREFRSLAENTPDNIARWDTEGRYLYINPVHERTLGKSLSEMIGTFVPDSHEAVKTAITQVALTKEPISVMQTVTTKEGEIEYHNVTIVPERDVSGNIISILAIGRDITDIKRAEEAIRSQSILLQSVMESSPDVTIFALDREYNYLSFNHNHSLIMNTIWGHEIALGMNKLSCITHEDDKEKAKEFFDKALAGESFIDESEYGDENLSRSYWQTYYAPMYHNNGEISGLTCFTLDITEKKVQEELLRRKEQESSALLNNLPGYVYTLKLSPEGELNFTYLSTGVAEVYGMNAEKLLDDIVATIHERIHPDDLPVIEANIIQSSQELTPFFAIYRIHHPVDGEKWLEARSVPEKLQDGTVIWHGIVLDVTDRKQQEERLHKTKAKLSAIITSIPDLIWVKDAEGVYMMCNTPFENFFGAPSDEIIGKTDYDFITREQADFFRQKDAEAFESGEIRINEEEIIFAHNSQYALLETRKVPVYDGEEFMGILGIGRDITERKEMEEAIAAKEHQFRILAEHTTDTIARYDHECIRLYANPAFAKAVGVKPEELVGKKPTDYNDSEQARGYEEAMKQVFKSGEEGEFEYSWPDKEGRIITSHIRIVPEKNENGMIHSVIASGRDITERKRMELKILQNQSRLNEAQKIAKVGSWELEFPGLELSWSDEIYRIFEIDPDKDQPSYDHFLNAIHPDDREFIDTVYARSLTEQTPYDAVHRLLMSDGRIKYVHERGESVYNPDGIPIRSIGTIQDVTEQKIIEKQIEHMAQHDTLTGLPNRILLEDRSDQAIAYAKRNHTKTALLFIDLDEFKVINDSLGHSLGDETLKQIALRLQGCLRETDTLSRLGGDEFVVILSSIADEVDVTLIVDKLLKTFDDPFNVADHHLSVSGSIGIALYPDHGNSFESLLQNADAAMYKAKELGKNGYCFYSKKMNHNINGLFKMRNDLRSALEFNEFILHYQPQIDLATGTIIGAEALIRWNHPQLGMTPPMSFIPIAESSGLIVQIGQWVIEEACAQAARWQKMGIDITVAVNISAIQFKRGDLERVVKNALATSGIDPKQLELELTESIIMHDTDKTLQSVRNLKALGVQLSIDDFGTGYSSLAYLKRFAVDKLKIDQSFVRDILSDQEDAIIVETIIQMAKSLNLKTIAEGVEDAQVLSVVESFGCDEVQGYHFAKPLEASDFEHYYTHIHTQKESL